MFKEIEVGKLNLLNYEIYDFKDFYNDYHNGTILPSDGEVEYVLFNNNVSNVHIEGWGGFIPENGIEPHTLTLEALKIIATKDVITILFLNK